MSLPKEDGWVLLEIYVVLSSAELTLQKGGSLFQPCSHGPPTGGHLILVGNHFSVAQSLSATGEPAFHSPQFNAKCYATVSG